MADEDTYGYKLTQEVRNVMSVSESTLYPVLRRLMKEGYLETYDQEYMGRNRRYIILSAKGKLKHLDNIKEWTHFSQNVDSLLRKGELKMTKETYLERLEKLLEGMDQRKKKKHLRIAENILKTLKIKMLNKL